MYWHRTVLFYKQHRLLAALGYLKCLYWKVPSVFEGDVTFWCELLLLIDKIFYTCKLGMINFQTIQVYNYSALSSAGIQSHEDKCIHNLLFTCCCKQNIICFWDSVASNCILRWYSHFSTWTVFKFQYLQPISAFCYSTLFVWGFLCAVVVW